MNDVLLAKSASGGTKNSDKRDDDGERAHDKATARGWTPRPPASVAPYVARIRSKTVSQKKCGCKRTQQNIATDKVPLVRTGLGVLNLHVSVTGTPIRDRFRRFGVRWNVIMPRRKPFVVGVLLDGGSCCVLPR